MSLGMQLDVIGLIPGDSGHGTLIVRFSSLADCKAAIARLQPGSVICDNLGDARYLSISQYLTPKSSDFPCEVRLDVIESERPPDSVRCRMLFGNNFLQSGSWVDVINFDPPSPDGSEGLVRALCANLEEYTQLRRFVDEPHGSSLSEANGSGRQWYVQRIADDGSLAKPFPQKVNVRLRWLRLD